MSFIKVNHKSPGVAFFFNSVFTAIIFAAVLIFNDYIDRKYNLVNNNSEHILKGGVHAISIFIFALLITYLFRILFGWGNSLIG